MKEGFITPNGRLQNEGAHLGLHLSVAPFMGVIDIGTGETVPQINWQGGDRIKFVFLQNRSVQLMNIPSHYSYAYMELEIYLVWCYINFYINL